MQDPHDSMSQLAEQMNWLAQLMNSEFWQQIQSGMDSTRTPGQRVGMPPNLHQAHTFGRPINPPAPNQYPPLEIYVTPADVVLCASLPGASPQTVAASLTTPSELVLEAFVPPDGLAAPLLRERFSGYCARTVTLPAPVRASGAKHIITTS